MEFDRNTKMKSTMHVLTLSPMKRDGEFKTPSESQLYAHWARFQWNDEEQRYVCREQHDLDRVLGVNMGWHDDIDRWKAAIHVNTMGTMMCIADEIYIDDADGFRMVPHSWNAHTCGIINGRIPVDTFLEIKDEPEEETE